MLRLIIFFIVCGSCVCESGNELTKFPDDFRFGIATASYQIEGAWNISDKGESTWDRFTHSQSHKIKDRSNGDVACDSYHLYKRDIEMLKELGVNFYRFSLSWPRLLPTGFANNVSRDGLAYYNDMIDELLANDIQPMVTLFHWETPQVFEDIGGWTNPMIVDLFAEYANVAFKHFGDRVKEWITFNEPYNMCLFGYGSRTGFVVFAPDINFHGFGEYQCSHNVIKAHAKVYHMYNETFRAKQRGKLSMASIILWAEPESESEEDKAVVEKSLQFNMGWFCHPIYSKEGDYPRVMRDEVDRMSKLQGYTKSRLPSFTREEVEYIKGTYDFIGMNYYTAVIYKNDGKRPEREVPSHENDLGHYFYQGSDWETGASSWLKLRPEGLRKSLKWVADEYGSEIEILITENGYSSRGGLEDPDRVKFFNTHLNAVLEAIYIDNVNVTAFTAWSLMDNFEWVNGYTERFGLYEVDFKSANKTRTPRMSALVYKEIISSKSLNYSYVPDMSYVKMENASNETNYNFIYIGIIVVVCGIILIVHLVCKAKKKKRFEKVQVVG